jgi:hypothetical protein
MAVSETGMAVGLAGSLAILMKRKLINKKEAVSVLRDDFDISAIGFPSPIRI